MELYSQPKTGLWLYNDLYYTIFEGKTPKKHSPFPTFNIQGSFHVPGIHMFFPSFKKNSNILFERATVDGRNPAPPGM